MCIDAISYLLGKKQGGGGEAPTLINKNISANGTYNASDDEADEYKKVVVDVPPTTYPDWTAIGYQGTPQPIIDGYNYAKQIYDNWDVSQTNLSNKFSGDKDLFIMPMIDTSNATDMSAMCSGCSKLIEIPLLNTSNATNMSSLFSSCDALMEIPLIDTSNATNMSSMFSSCRNLVNIPVLNTSSTTNMGSMFSSCANLTDQSLDNILQMCINTTSAYTKTKKLSSIGISSMYYQATRIQALPHYQDFIDAGWTIGY